MNVNTSKEMSPFPHKVFDNFLTEGEYQKVITVFNRLEFFEKKSDLFHIFQSNELNAVKNFEFFIHKISQVFKQFPYSEQNTHVESNKHEENKENGLDNRNEPEKIITMFASFYMKNHYLLPHDDMVETRIQAFTYYLDDCTDSKLTLFENDGLTVAGKVKVKANRLVIFDVSPISFHEVENCYNGGRKALTGWLNFTNQVDFDKHAEKNHFKDKTDKLNHLFLSDRIKNTQVELFDFDFDIEDVEYNIIEDIDFPFEDFQGKKLLGPVTSKRVTELLFPVIHLPKLGQLLRYGVYEVNKFDYILLEEMNKDVLDVFIFDCAEEVSDKFHSIIYVDNISGDKVFEISLVKNTLHIIKRGNMSWFMNRTLVEFKMLHAEYSLN